MAGVELRLEHQATLVLIGTGIQAMRYVELMVGDVPWDSAAIEPGETEELAPPSGVIQVLVQIAEDVVLGTQDLKVSSDDRVELRLTTLAG